MSFTHIFSSDLQRAHKTAIAVRSAQHESNGTTEADHAPNVIALPVLREQDFGYYEGKPFSARTQDSNKSGKENHRLQHLDDPDYKDMESKESMAARASEYLQQYIVPIIHGQADQSAIAIVSHGIMLSHLWRSFLKLLPKNSVALSPGLSVGTSGVTPLEYLGGWSNTGYLELNIQRKEAASEDYVSLTPTPTPAHASLEVDNVALTPLADIDLSGFTATIITVNGKEHLKGLKRTRGGVGSSRHDEGQKTMESFFKKQKV